MNRNTSSFIGPSPKTHQGFTLIELMVVISILGIIATLAIPSYVDSVRQSYRADGQATLQRLTLSLERFYTANGRFKDAGVDLYSLATDFGQTCIPSDVICTSGDARFEIQVTFPTDGTYTASLAAKNNQVEDACSAAGLSIDHTNKRTPHTAGTERCWD